MLISMDKGVRKGRGLRILDIARLRRIRGQTCDASNRGRAHDSQDNDNSQECPECRGETPPETP